MTNEKFKLVDDDKLMSIADLVETFGLGPATWREAIKSATLEAAVHGRSPNGTRVLARNARAFALAWHEANKKTATPKEPTE